MLTKDLQYARFTTDSSDPDKVSLAMGLNCAGTGRQVVSEEEKAVQLITDIAEQKEIHSWACSGVGGW